MREYIPIEVGPQVDKILITLKEFNTPQLIVILYTAMLKVMKDADYSTTDMRKIIDNYKELWCR